MPFRSKNPSNTEYPAQNTVGVLLKRTWLANWATHLVRFKNKINEKILTFSRSVPPTPTPDSRGLGGSGRWEHLKSSRGGSGCSQVWKRRALRLLTHLSTRGPGTPRADLRPQVVTLKKKVLFVPKSVYSKYFLGHFLFRRLECGH